jgi:hypothetical protein
MTTTPVTSKPALVGALQATWRASTEHFIEQVQRFVRLTVVSAIPALVSAITAATVKGDHFDWRTLLALVVPFAETAYRQVFPALGAAKVDTAPGATIVPAEVGVTTAPRKRAHKAAGFSLVEALVAAFFGVLILIAIVILANHIH